MVKEIVIFAIMLCPEVKENTCTNPGEADSSMGKEYSKFVTAVTPWKKIEQKTNYFDSSETTKKR